MVGLKRCDGLELEEGTKDRVHFRGAQDISSLSVRRLQRIDVHLCGLQIIHLRGVRRIGLHLRRIESIGLQERYRG